jgi:DNA ligase-1
MKSEFLQLAHDYDPKKHTVYSYYFSEKLDGLRCFWDGGISSGLPCSDVPYANTTKHSRFKSVQYATGLWTRYCQPIHAPKDFLNQLPKFPLDGEITCGDFQRTMSLARTGAGNCVPELWKDAQYSVFESPSFQEVFQNRSINNENLKIKLVGCVEWAKYQAHARGTTCLAVAPFYQKLYQLKEILPPKGTIRLHFQCALPSNRIDLDKFLKEALDGIIENGGEGAILRSPVSLWNPIRTYDLLKVKPLKDAEATVVGYRWGKETDLDRSRTGLKLDKMVGKMGALIVKLDSGVVFDIGIGFKDNERRMAFTENTLDFDDALMVSEASSNQGGVVTHIFTNPLFPIGTKITFKYRELTNDGVPKEARFHRIYNAS